MWSPEEIVQVLRERGEVWEVAPGLIGLRGDALALFQAIEQRIAGLARAEALDEWCVPSALPLETLARADYFTSFPQWLTVAAHLRDDPAALERVASAPDPAAEAHRALVPARVALSPAVCYHTYATLAGTTVASPTRMTAQGVCWRHEGDRLAPLERGWAFSMREIVCLGDSEDVETFRRRGRERAVALAAELKLGGTIAAADDPFFAPTSRGKALLQRVKGLKHELLLPMGSQRTIAAASFNHHETFFGDAFGIRLPDGGAAASGCVAFGIERWLLAFLCAHGPDAADWPALPTGSAIAVPANGDARMAVLS